MANAKTTTTRKPASVAKLYAKALFELAEESRSVDSFAEEFQALIEFLGETPTLEAALSAFMFSAEEREKLATEVAQKAQLSPLLGHFIRLLTEKNRILLLPQIFEAFRGLVDESKGVVRGSVTTAEALTDAEKADLSKAFGRKLNKQIILESQTDKTILGGLIVEIQGLTFDGSLKTTIRRLRESLERQSL